MCITRNPAVRPDIVDRKMSSIVARGPQTKLPAQLPCRNLEPFRSMPSMSSQMTLTYVLTFRSAHLAFIIKDSFFRIAALIGFRPALFFGAVLAFFGADLPFHFAQRCFIARSEERRVGKERRSRWSP